MCHHGKYQQREWKNEGSKKYMAKFEMYVDRSFATSKIQSCTPASS